MVPIRYHLVLLFLSPCGWALPYGSRHLVRDSLTERGFDIPIRTRRNDGKTTDSRRRDSVSGSVALGDNQDVFYTVPIQLGNTVTAVDLDTGSSDLWVISNQCHTSQCQNSTVATYPLSSLTPSNTTVTMNYGDSKTATYASGPIGMDTVTMAGISVLDQQFAAVDNTTNPITADGAAGIFGLGFPSESQVQNSLVTHLYNSSATTDDFISSTSSTGPLLSRMVMSGALEQPMFAITLQRDTVDVGGTGMLSIGKLPDGVNNDSLTWVPVRLYSAANGGLAPPTFAPNETYPLRWEVELDGVYLDGKKLADSTIPAQGINSTTVSALIDTGNSILRGPSDVVQNILSSVSPTFASSASKNPNAATLPCSTPHTLAFQMGGQMFPVDPRDFINSAGGASTCVANNLLSTDPPSRSALYSWSLGDTFLKSNLVAFYYGNLTHPSVDPPRIGFMSMVPANASQLLVNAAQEAQLDGGKFESTVQLAPTSGLASATTTLSLPELFPSTTTASPSQTASVTVSQLKNSALIRINRPCSAWFVTLALLLFLFYGI